MSLYVDGFLLTVPANRLEEYRKLAEESGKIWMEHGALGFYENTGDDLETKEMRSFVDAAGAKAGDVVLFSYIVYSDRASRDAINKKVMEDPRLKDMCNPDNLPFDCKRMCWGGFSSLVAFSK